MIIQKEISLPHFPRGFHLITDIIRKQLKFPESGILHLFIKHTSAGLTINENYDPTVLDDFETSFNILAPENMDYYTHTIEGSDDMPAHIKSTLTGSSVSIPVTDGKLNLGVWQGIYLCEFRNGNRARKIVATIYY
ncbi:MAG: YjbQ family protein [Saprospiraceae bacterium]|nr:YjbQ family protein [Saprospiraceae bacterium]